MSRASQRHVDRHRILKTPTGEFFLLQRADGSTETGWVNGAAPPGKRDQSLLPRLAKRIERYFRGEDVSFGDVPTPAGGDFFRRCWNACRSIPRGSTITYAELAKRAGGSISAARAAGQAMRRNPQPIITPCHRVIGSGGRLHGFAGCTSASSESLGIKRFLLELEQAAPRATTQGTADERR